jgi:hypothetical protein
MKDLKGLRKERRDTNIGKRESIGKERKKEEGD